MSLNPGVVRVVVDKWLGAQPHPEAPSLTRGEYEAYARIAAKQGQTSHPTAQQVESLAHELKGLELSPAEFNRLWMIAKPLTQRLLNRLPSVAEISHLRDQTPGNIVQYFNEHPHHQHPEVSAGDFARYYAAATPIAKEHAGRNPVPHEVALFAQAGYDANGIRDHYKR